MILFAPSSRWWAARPAVELECNRPSQRGEVNRNACGYQLILLFPVSRPKDPQGNGNGKHAFCSSGGGLFRDGT